MRLGHGGKSPPDLDRCFGQLLHREAGQNKDEVTSDKALHEPVGVLGELFVLAGTDD